MSIARFLPASTASGFRFAVLPLPEYPVSTQPSAARPSRAPPLRCSRDRGAGVLSRGLTLAGRAGAMAGVVDFQDEEQVKSFLENMEVECNYQCYREKDPDGERCQRSLGTRGTHGEGLRAARVTSDR